MNSIGVLIIDDEEIVRKAIITSLDGPAFRLFEAGKADDAFAVFARERIDIAILDIRLPERDGFSILEQIKKDYPECEVIMMTGHGDSTSVLTALRLGAFDFFFKPLSLSEIKGAIQRTRKYIELNSRYKEIHSAYILASDELRSYVGDLVGESGAMKAVMHLALKAAAASTTSVLITGESGTGKELVARTIHYASERSKRSFYALNASAIPESLMESEFFGHLKGAFTGAETDKAGCFEAADGGTLFLDEIGDMPLMMQSKILRALEEHTIKRLGCHKEIPFDVRIISATNADIHDMVKTGRFRQDLFHRLNTFEITVPPLRAHPEDIPLLAAHFCKKIGRALGKPDVNIHQHALDVLRNYSYPGNIRELKNMIERAIILCDGNQLEAKHFPISDNEISSAVSPVPRIPEGGLDEAVRDLISQALAMSGNNKLATAKLLKISPQSLYRKLKKLHVIK
ncbi:MAG: sigma-54-dependent Fis family transcriptional regulator [Spirochaetes bacterium]|nr:sigma-54-dependent Fis family transcriptional regulator [Spirochaetota bacterium]